MNEAQTAQDRRLLVAWFVDQMSHWLKLKEDERLIAVAVAENGEVPGYTDLFFKSASGLFVKGPR